MEHWLIFAVFVGISFSFLLALSIVLRPLDIWSPAWKKFFSGLGSIDGYGLLLASYALVGVVSHYQGDSPSNPMFWRSFLFFCVALLGYIFWIYPGFEGDGIERIDNQQYLRLLAAATVAGVLAYSAWRVGLILEVV